MFRDVPECSGFYWRLTKESVSILTSYHQDQCQEIKFFVGSIFSSFYLPRNLPVEGLNEEYYIWIMLVLVYGLQNKECYIWSALVLVYGLQNEECYIKSMLVLVYGLLKVECYIKSMLAFVYGLQNKSVETPFCFANIRLLHSPCLAFKLMEQGGSGVLHLKRACFGLWLIERGILLLKHFSGSCFALWLMGGTGTKTAFTLESFTYIWVLFFGLSSYFTHELSSASKSISTLV